MARGALPASALASAALHAALFALLWRAPPPPRGETVTIEVLEDPPRPAPLPARPPPPAPPEPPGRPRPAPARVAVALPPDAPRAPPPGPEAPPPPNAPPPPGAPARAPVRVGIALSAATESGAFAAPVGNTLQGAAPRTAPAPAAVTPYAAERVVPPTQVTALPRPVATAIGKEEYPPDALAQGLEGRVVLRLLVDATGKVVDAVVVEDPGHGFGAAAARAARAFRFEPARRGDEAVATWLRFTVSFELP